MKFSPFLLFLAPSQSQRLLPRTHYDLTHHSRFSHEPSSIPHKPLFLSPSLSLFVFMVFDELLLLLLFSSVDSSPPLLSGLSTFSSDSHGYPETLACHKGTNFGIPRISFSQNPNPSHSKVSNSSGILNFG